MRVVSLLPSATEILFRLLKRQPGGIALGTVKLVGRSHECDYPAEYVKEVPILTSQHTKFTTPKDVDDQVREALSTGTSLYSVDVDQLKSLAPDVILTQSLCNVCSIDVSTVHKIAASMTLPPKVVSLNPYTLDEVIDSLLTVGKALDLKEEALNEQASLKLRIAKCHDMKKSTSGLSDTFRGKNVAFIEWTDPLYVGGHWTPELIQMAGGFHGINPKIGVKSFVVTPEQLLENQPDICIVCPCGLTLDETSEMVESLEEQSWWWKLPAVQADNVALVDGNQMFNRPGPRLVDCLEWLTWYLNTSSKDRSNLSNPLEQEEKFPWKQYVPSKLEEVEARKDSRKNIQVNVSRESHNNFPPDIEEAHRLACEKGDKMYIDPATGYQVFTELASKERGFCCGRGCRHCAYGHWNVPAAQRKNTISNPTLLRAKPKKKTQRQMGTEFCKDSLNVLFWSGGKDSFMTLVKVLDSENGKLSDTGKLPTRTVLLTSFDPSSGMIPEQDISFSEATDQIKSLGLNLDLMATPLPANCSNDVYVDTVSKALSLIGSEYEIPNSKLRLIFGDLHLEDIRKWREQMFSQYECAFPIFKHKYSDLCDLLFSNPLLDYVEISNVTVKTDTLKVGMKYDRNVFDALNDSAVSIDPFGELGEFHTKCVFKKLG